MTAGQNSLGSDRRSLRVGIDGLMLSNGGGPQRYVTELSKRLDRLLPQAEFFVYSSVPFEMPVVSARWHARVETKLKLLGARRAAWSKLREGVLAHRDGVNVFWAPAPYLPFLPRCTRAVVTVYDLRHELIPDMMPRISVRFHRAFFDRDLARATVITAISDGTAQRLRRMTGFSARAIIRSAVSETFYPRPQAEVRSVLAALGVTTPYLLTVTSWQPNKNTEPLIHSIMKMRNEGLIAKHQLVVVGDGPARAACALDCGINEEIRLLGHVRDEVLAALYTGASVFVFPSSYEGFGIPVAEARACGTTVVTTDIMELREAGDSDTIYVELTEEGIRNGVMAALQRPPRERVHRCSWTWESEAEKLAPLLYGTN